MKKNFKIIIAILVVSGALLNEILKDNLLETIGVSEQYVGVVKLAGLIISVILAYFQQNNIQKREIGGSNSPSDKDEK